MNRSTALGLVLGIFGIVLVPGCAGSGGEDAASGNADLSAAASKPPRPLTDPELAAAFASAPPSLGEDDAKKLIDATISPLATTARLKMLNDFVTKVTPDSDTRSFLAGAMEGVIWATPRDVVSTPSGFGGQSLKTLVEVDSGIAGPTRLQIKGVAANDYTLDFTIAGFKVSGVRVPKGSNESATAKILKKAIDASNDAIMKTIGDDKTFAPFGGDHSDSPSGVDDFEVSTSKGALLLLVAQNG